jgi:hypothetical protein
MADLKSRTIQQHSGGNHSAVILDRDVRLGLAVWDPARGQFAFSPDNNDLVLSAADAGAITTILNGLSK